MEIGDKIEKVIETLSQFDTNYFRQLITNLNPEQMAIVLGASAFIVILALLRGMVRTAVIIIAIGATIVLVHYTVPPAGESITLSQIIALFLGGTFITATTLYFLFIRS
jgi:hypothetical protein